MPSAATPLEDLATQVRHALETSDVDAFGRLLHPAARWGPPGATDPPCRTRQDVLAWYGRGRARGVRAEVTDVAVVGGRLLVGLVVRGGDGASRDRGGAAMRWQVMTVSEGLIAQIVGFDDRLDAVAWARGAGGEGPDDESRVDESRVDEGPAPFTPAS